MSLLLQLRTPSPISVGEFEIRITAKIIAQTVSGGTQLRAAKRRARVAALVASGVEDRMGNVLSFGLD